MDNRVFFTRVLDPAAQEFTPPTLFPAAPTQIYYTYPYPSHCQAPPVQNISYPATPAYVRVDPPPLPVALPPASTTPTRALLLSSVPTDVSESIIRRDLEVYGDVRAVEMERVKEGIVAVHFYDLRHAQTALGEIQEQHMQHQCRVRQHFDAVMNINNSPYEVAAVSFPVPLPPPSWGLVSGRAVWAQFMVPGIGGYPESYNQGTLVIFNVDCQVHTRHLRDIFEEFGCVKELREPPLNRDQRFIEFYDTRGAARAFSVMNGKKINGRHLIIEFSRSACYNKRFPKSTHNTPRNPRYVPPSSDRSPSFIHSPPHFSGRSSKNPSGSRNTSVGQGATVASLCLNDGERVRSKNPKKASATYSSISGGTNMKQVNNNKVGCSSKEWKGWIKNEKEYDPRFLINEDSTVLPNCSDPRTTVMIKNIPNKYSQKLLLNMLDNHCIHHNQQIDEDDDEPLSSYDFVYLPIDFVNKCNVGYGFVNMTSPEATLRLYNSFHRQNWEVFNSRKICQVTYARLQGVEALKEHFKTSKFPCAAEEYMPVVFSPPRDGRTLSNPVPITGFAVINNSTATNKEQEDYGDDDEEGEL
ncbi:Terminal ear1 [Heracleum sosnowskyi]|uniref:Terminal ear1 n=1 Tax=Heracleum sosnowskyi TaxID=360622 RepID=A0AAD8I1T2_9APIA|nr:Terminal ear1 [Heracleum sosnowskyi]